MHMGHSHARTTGRTQKRRQSHAHIAAPPTLDSAAATQPQSSLRTRRRHIHSVVGFDTYARGGMLSGAACRMDPAPLGGIDIVDIDVHGDPDGRNTPLRWEMWPYCGDYAAKGALGEIVGRGAHLVRHIALSAHVHADCYGGVQQLEHGNRADNRVDSCKHLGLSPRCVCVWTHCGHGPVVGLGSTGVQPDQWTGGGCEHPSMRQRKPSCTRCIKPRSLPISVARSPRGYRWGWMGDVWVGGDGGMVEWWVGSSIA